jgi:hypothetical protein
MLYMTAVPLGWIAITLSVIAGLGSIQTHIGHLAISAHQKKPQPLGTADHNPQ